MFLVPKEVDMVPKAPQKAPKTIPQGIQSAVENRLDEKILPGPSQRPIWECFGVRVGVCFATFRVFVCNFFCLVLELSWLLTSFSSSFFSLLCFRASLAFQILMTGSKRVKHHWARTFAKRHRVRTTEH